MSRSCLDAAIDIAREAGAVLAALFGRAVRSEAKGRFDRVTEADRASEAVILRRIRAEYPSHDVLAEETGEHGGGTSTYRWYVDPLDGTKNFLRGYPAFTVSLALECAGQLAVGVVFDPTRDELFAAERGAGAFCNERRIHASGARHLEECLVATGFPSGTRHGRSSMELLRQVSLSTQGVRRTGSSALDLSYVACGRVDAFWDIGLAAWDIAAGLVLVAEAGGRCSDLRGIELTRPAPDLVAGNRAIQPLLVHLLGAVAAR